MHEAEDDLDRERRNADRLAAALETLRHHVREDDGTMHIVIGNVKAANHLTVGHVIDGALALHAETKKARGE